MPPVQRPSTAGSTRADTTLRRATLWRPTSAPASGRSTAGWGEPQGFSNFIPEASSPEVSPSRPVVTTTYEKLFRPRVTFSRQSCASSLYQPTASHRQSQRPWSADLRGTLRPRSPPSVMRKTFSTMPARPVSAPSTRDSASPMRATSPSRLSRSTRVHFASTGPLRRTGSTRRTMVPGRRTKSLSGQAAAGPGRSSKSMRASTPGRRTQTRKSRRKKSKRSAPDEEPQPEADTAWPSRRQSMEATPEVVISAPVRDDVLTVVVKGCEGRVSRKDICMPKSYLELQQRFAEEFPDEYDNLLVLETGKGVVVHPCSMRFKPDNLVVFREIHTRKRADASQCGAVRRCIGWESEYLDGLQRRCRCRLCT